MRSKILFIVPPLLLLLLAGCVSLEKKHFKAVKFFNEHENLAAEYCSGKFPSETEIIKEPPLIITDTIEGPAVYVDCPDGTKKECPKNKIITRTIEHTITITKSNTAYETVLKNQINELKGDNVVLVKENEKTLKDLKNSRRYNWALGIALAICVILIIKKL